ncbi:MAG: HAD hydrolase family protein, partial [Hungatella sp.]
AITINGAVVIDTLEHHVLQEAKLEINTALSIFDMVQGYHIMYDAYVDGVGISEARFYDRLDEYKISKEIQTLIRATRVVYPDLREAVLEKGKPVEKINLFFRDQEEREKVRQLLAGRGDVMISSSFANNLEINAPGATKGAGLLCLASYLGIRPEETMACGDGENDHSMIAEAGIGVAMGNAERKLQEEANYVTATNDEDGVARAIERFALS